MFLNVPLCTSPEFVHESRCMCIAYACCVHVCSAGPLSASCAYVSMGMSPVFISVYVGKFCVWILEVLFPPRFPQLSDSLISFFLLWLFLLLLFPSSDAEIK